MILNVLVAKFNGQETYVSFKRELRSRDGVPDPRLTPRYRLRPGSQTRGVFSQGVEPSFSPCAKKEGRLAPGQLTD